MEVGKGPHIHSAHFSGIRGYKVSWEATETMRPYPLATTVLVLGVMLAVQPGPRAIAAADEPLPTQIDHDFVQAAAKHDKATVGRLLDTDFTWTDADGKTQARTDVLKSLPAPALGNETGAQLKPRTYGQVGAVMSGRDKVHVLRIWVNRPAGWRLIVYHEVALGQQAATAAGSGVNECQNPCKTVPFKPKTQAEQAVIASWQALETGVTNHDASAWSPHIAEEFVMLGSTNDHPLSKADRIRSEEHTSELQSPMYLVCRLLLEKK